MAYVPAHEHAGPARTRKIRVAHVITRLCRGGAQENTFHTVRLHDRTRFEVDLIAGPPHGHEGSLEETVREAGIAIHRIPHLLRAPHPMRDVWTVRQLTQLFRKRAYDVVHTHTSKAGFLGRLAALRAGVPVVAHTSHGNVFHGYFGAWPTNVFVAMERRAAKWTDALIELTPRSVAECLERRVGTAAQYRVIPSGIDTAAFDQAYGMRAMVRRRLKIADGELLIGGAGRLEPVKGMEHFVRAAVALGERYGNLQFRIAGVGSQLDALRELAAPLGARMGFLGYWPNVPEFMAALDVLVVPSVNEGMGRVLLEAGAAGVPVVASKVGGIVDVVRDGETGLLVEPRNSDAIAEALETLLAHPIRRMAMGSNAYCAIGPEYSLDAMVQRIEALYEGLIEERVLMPEDEFLSKQRFLVIAPHPDDECFGCAGTMARVKALGGEVYVMVCSLGDLKHYDGQGALVKAETRAHELEAVMQYLEVDDYDVLYRDAETHLRLDAIPRRDLIAQIERESTLAYDRLQPTMVAIPVSSYNQDHEAVFRAAFTAARPGVPSIKPFQKLVIGYNNTSLFWSLEREKFHPNFYVDISEYLEKKLTALSMHASQMRDDVHHSSVKNVEYTARIRGSEISVEAAEGYMVFRHVL